MRGISYVIADRLSPTRRTGLLSCRARSRPGHAASCTKTAPRSPIPTGSAPESRPTVPSFLKSRANPIERGRSARRQGRGPARQCLPSVNVTVRHQALQLDDDTVPVRDVRSVFHTAGPEMAGNTLPAIINLLDADGAVPVTLRRARD